MVRKMDNRKRLKYLLAALAVLAVIMLCLWASGVLFMLVYRLPLEKSRPWTIIQYWQIYGAQADRKMRATLMLSSAAPFLMACAAIFAAMRQKPKALHGEARFANMQEIRKSGLLTPSERSILVGNANGRYLTYGGYQFVLLAAPTRSGKGVSMVVPNCLNYSDSIVVLDIKFENFDITSGFRAENGQDVFLFAPFGRSIHDNRINTHRYNPLEYISENPSQRISDIFSIAYSFYPDPLQGDAFWADNARNLFLGLCLMVLETPDIPHTLGEILRQASGKGQPLKDYLTSIIQERQNSDNPLSSNCTDALFRFIGNSDNTLAGILSSFNAPLLIWSNPIVDAATSANDFDLRDVRRKRMSIYIGIQPDKIKDAKVLVNLFFDQLCNLNTKQLPAQNPDLKYQCLLILDEFTAIGRVNVIAHAVSYLAGYNIRLLTVIQNKSQLQDVYGNSGATTLMANHALMVMFAPSPVVQADANEYSEMLGYQTVKSTSRSRQLTGRTSRSESESDQRRALMLPQEIRELGLDNQIVSLENIKPVLCRKIRYYQDPNFLSRANHPLPDIPVIDIDLFIARQDNRIRPVAAADLDGLTAEKVAGTDRLSMLKGDSDDEINSFVDEFFETVATGVSSTEALALTESMFSEVRTEDEIEETESEEKP